MKSPISCWVARALLPSFAGLGSLPRSSSLVNFEKKKTFRARPALSRFSEACIDLRIREDFWPTTIYFAGWPYTFDQASDQCPHPILSWFYVARAE